MPSKPSVEPRSDFARELLGLAEQLRAREDISNVELRLALVAVAGWQAIFADLEALPRRSGACSE
jgi:hypothetical protein